MFFNEKEKKAPKISNICNVISSFFQNTTNIRGNDCKFQNLFAKFVSLKINLC